VIVEKSSLDPEALRSCESSLEAWAHHRNSIVQAFVQHSYVPLQAQHKTSTCH